MKPERDATGGVMSEQEIITRLRALSEISKDKLGDEQHRPWRVACKEGAELLERLIGTRSETRLNGMGGPSRDAPGNPAASNASSAGSSAVSATQRNNVIAECVKHINERGHLAAALELQRFAQSATDSGREDV